MAESTTLLRFPGPEDDPAGLETTGATISPTRVVQRLRGIDHENDLARALQAWRPAGGIGGDGPRFMLGGRLGQGSQGVVFALRDRDAQRTVALKALNGRQVDDEDIARFLHEVQVTAQLEHPGVVPVHDVGVLPDGTVFYTMKRVEGMVLTDWMVGRAGSAAHRFEVIQLFLKICDTMAFAHSRGVVHRDLKPRNIMVGTYGEVLVMDWGLAKVMGAAEPRLDSGSDLKLSEAADHETLAGTAVGTPAYMSPEQARGELLRVDHRSDVYGLGVILYEMIADASPYVRGDLRRTVAQVSAGQWAPISKQPKCRDLPRRLAAVVHKAMAFSPDDRYQHVSEMAADLRAFLAGGAVTAYRESLFDTIARLHARHRRLLAVAGMALLVVLTAVGGFLWWQQARAGEAVESLRVLAARKVAEGDWAAARQASERILAYRPGDREAQIAAALYDDRLRSEAERQAKDAERVSMVREAHARAAQLRARAAELATTAAIPALAEATQLAKQAQALHPEDATLGRDYERWVAELTRLQAAEEARTRREAEERQRREDAARFVERADEAERAGDLDAAISHLRGSLELLPDPIRLERLVVLNAQRRERLLEAERVLREEEKRNALGRRRAEAEVQLDAAQASLSGGHPDEALTQVERAAVLMPDHPRLVEVRRNAESARQLARIQSAEQLLTLASTAGRTADERRERLSARQAEVLRLRDELRDNGDQLKRSTLASAEEDSRVAARDRAASLAEAVGLLNRALALTPDHPPVRAALAAFWIDRLAEAESIGDLAAAAAAEAQAKAYDDGRQAQLLAGTARIVNRCPTPIRLQAISRTANRTDAPSGPVIEVAVGAEAVIGRGRYLVTALDGVRFAILLERGRSHEVILPALPQGLPGMAVFIPGGILREADGRPDVQVKPFVMAARETTCGEWLAFLNDPAVVARYEAAIAQGQLILAPRTSPFDKDSLWRRRAGFLGRGGSFVLEAVDGSQIDPACPVSGISHDDAVAYAAWRARQDGRPWRLPEVAEWQFAVQGGDGRSYPWGSAEDLLFCGSAAALARSEDLIVSAGGRFPTDCSVQGVFDLAGSRSEFCAGASNVSADLRPLLGGSYHELQPERFTSWSRRDVDRRLVHYSWGVRLVYSP